MTIALTRGVSERIGDCELTHLEREPIDVGAARLQHRAYEASLSRLGCEVVALGAEPGLPDSVFIEDTAVVLDELAILTRPGAESRRAEIEGVSTSLGRYRSLERITAPGTLDGGDVLVAGRRIFTGLSARTNEEGAAQLRTFVEPLGYEFTALPVESCLHLKSAVTCIGGGRLLVNRDWVDASAFAGLELVEVDPDEPSAANALLVRERVVFPARFIRTRARLEREGVPVEPVDISELAKAEGGVTCCSLVFEE